MISAGLIGVSGFAAVHYGDLIGQVQDGYMRLAGAAVINQAEEPEKCARLKQLGCELFTDYKAMLERFRNKLDLCCIPTGIHLHAPMTLAALRAGANVFVEKPLAATIQEVRAIRACERETGRFVAVGYQDIYADETLLMKRALCEGKIGALQSIACRGLWPRSDHYYLRNNWAGRLKVGESWVLDSPFNNAFAHYLNLLCFLAGKTMAESARLKSMQAELYRAREIESADTACMRILTASGEPLTFFCTHCSEINHDVELLVHGAGGWMQWKAGRIAIHSADGACHEGHCAEPRKATFAKLRKRLADPSAFICTTAIAGTQTLCANGAFDSSRIHSIEKQYLQRKTQDNHMFTVISDIDKIIARCFEEKKLFAEAGVPWARAGKIISLEDYRWTRD